MLGRHDAPLVEGYDLAMLDLDGVVYIGPDAVPGAQEHLAVARAAGMQLAFITNNAGRTPQAVAEHLRELGIVADPADVVTSAQAAARLLADRFPPRSRIFLLGGPGLRDALLERDLVPVSSPDDDPVAVVSGYGPELAWKQVAKAAILLRSGVPWVAANTDMTFPTPHGIGPGHGVMVRMLSEFSDHEPVVAGKPQRPLFDETRRRVGGERPLMVGDRLDTDIEGGRNAGVDTLLVLTGVTGLTDLVAATPRQRPTYLSVDLAGLTSPHPVPQPAGAAGDGAALGGWTVSLDQGRLQVEGAGSTGDWWRCVAVTAWRHVDAGHRAADASGLEPPLPPPPASGR